MRNKNQLSSQLVTLPVATADGVFIAHYSDRGLAGLDFPVQGSDRNARVLSGNVKVSAQVIRWHRLASQALKAALAGSKARDLPPLDWTDGTDFQQAVWREMLKLAPGETISYGPRQTQGLACRGPRLWRESTAGAGALSSGPGGEPKAGRFFRRLGLETNVAGPRGKGILRGGAGSLIH